MSEEYLSGEGKIEVIRSYAKMTGIPNFCETGTATGDTPAALVDDFEHLWTIDIAADNYQTATLRFLTEHKVTPIIGDSELWIPMILQVLIRTTLFWLDAHYDDDGNEDRRGLHDCPTEFELASILDNGRANNLKHVVLIDDARLFGSHPAYPAQAAIEGMAKRYGYTYSLADDIMRLLPR
jgi:hypothetical protein